MYLIVEQIKKRKMPMELVLLPIVESAFDPHATSSANAAGLWQIVPSTGRNYGLKQNQWYDGRRDVVASTKAALDMMERLNDITRERLTDLAGRLFFDTVPTLSAIGPLEHLPPLSDITAALSAQQPARIKANG